jgi:hypothetical protein
MYCRVLNRMSTSVSEVRAAFPDDGGSTYLCNVGRHSIKNTAVHPRRFWASYLPPWEVEISNTTNGLNVICQWGWDYVSLNCGHQQAYCSSSRSHTDRGKLKNLEKSPRATLSTTNPTWTEPGTKLGLKYGL